MLNDLLDYYEQNIVNIVETSLQEAIQRFESYRVASEIELSNIRHTMNAQLVIVGQLLRGKQIDDNSLNAILTALVERRVNQGYPLAEVLGLFQISKETIHHYFKKELIGHPSINITELMDLMDKLSHIFHKIELGVVGPYLEFQTKIIQTQEAFLKHKFTSLFRLVEAISNNLNIQEFCEILLDYLCRFYDVKISGVFLMDEWGKELFPQHLTGLSRRFKNEERIATDTSAFKLCLQENHAVSQIDQPYLINDIIVPLPKNSIGNSDICDITSTAHSGKHQIHERVSCSSLYAPMVGRQRTYGVVTLHCLKLRQFSQNEVQQLETLARIIAVALENARFYQNLIEEKGKLDAIVNSLKDGLILIDFHEEIVYINEPAARYLQQPNYRLFGASASIISDKLLANAKEAYIAQASYLRALANIGDHPTVECTLLKPENVDIRLTMFPVKDREHHFIGRGLIIEDVSHEKEINRMKSEFVAIASHTMRTPMTSIMGFASLLLEKEMPINAQKKYLEYIFRESQLLTDILNDMLDLTKIETGKISLKLMPMDLNDLLAMAVEENKKKYRRDIQVQITPKLPKVIADNEKIHQVLNNLINNALVYTTEKVKICVKKVNAVHMPSDRFYSSVNLNSSGLFPAILVSVEDAGKGIAKDQLDQIFEPFYRMKSERLSKPPGSGLGLTIVRYIVEAHGGKIWVESKPGKGSIFKFLLPLELTSSEKKLGYLAS